MTTQNSAKVRVLIWDEAPPHAPKSVYPDSIKGAIASGLLKSGPDLFVVTTRNLDDIEQGVAGDLLNDYDVIFWWGHARHEEVTDKTAEKVITAVKSGLGLIALHSAHYSKVFKGTLDATGHLFGGWRDNAVPGDTEEIRVAAPHHPIAKGIEDFVIPEEEMYGAPFGIPYPQAVIFQSYFPVGGEYFPSFVTSVGTGIDPDFTSGNGGGQNRGEGAGRVFYFRPGHEAFPTYYIPTVQQILHNAVLWAARRS